MKYKQEQKHFDIEVATQRDLFESRQFGHFWGTDIHVSNMGKTNMMKVERVTDPIIEIDDWIDEKYWPEWKVIVSSNREVIVKAPNKEEALIMAQNMEGSSLNSDLIKALAHCFTRPNI